MSVLSCLTLIIFMESRGVSDTTQNYVASVAVERAKSENTGICQSMRRKATYSWMWDGRKTKVDKRLQDSFQRIAYRQLDKPSLPGRLYFNECSLGKRYKTPYKVIRSDNLCFY